MKLELNPDTAVIVNEYAHQLRSLLFNSQNKDHEPEFIFALEEVYLEYIASMLEMVENEDDYIELVTSWLNSFLFELGIGIEEGHTTIRSKELH